MCESSAWRVAVVAITLALAACKFPALPDLAEDGGDVDAPDARPVRTGPLVTNGQAADLVLGQPSFGTNADRGITAQSFLPFALAFDGGRLWVADFTRYRILGWDTPTTSDASATHLLGQATFSNGTSNPISASTMGQPPDVVAVGGRVVVLDGANRVLVWNTQPDVPGEAADLVLGPDFTSTASGSGPAQMRSPSGGWSDGTRLLVRGGFTASRIWSWSAFPTASATPADLQLLGGPTVNAVEFTATGDVTSDGSRLIAVDTVHNRVLIWNAMPTSSGRPADVVLGQATFMTSTMGTSAAEMNTPDSVLVIDGALLVSDAGNDRVLVFDPVPTTSGTSATQVLGQTSPSVVAFDQSPSDRTLDRPTGLAVDGRKLFVADTNNRRVLRYDLALP